MLPPLAESMAHNHRPPATRITSYTGLPLMYARGRRAGAIHNRAMDGKATTALPARSPAAAGTRAGRVDRLLMRPAFDVALRVRRDHIRAGAGRRVQPAGWACTCSVRNAAAVRGPCLSSRAVRNRRRVRLAARASTGSCSMPGQAQRYDSSRSHPDPNLLPIPL
jgi:hypothetical protein